MKILEIEVSYTSDRELQRPLKTQKNEENNKNYHIRPSIMAHPLWML